MYMDNNEYINNKASLYGGAIYMLSSDLNLTNTTFDSNEAIIGAAIRYS